MSSRFNLSMASVSVDALRCIIRVICDAPSWLMTCVMACPDFWLWSSTTNGLFTRTVWWKKATRWLVLMVMKAIRVSIRWLLITIDWLFKTNKLKSILINCLIFTSDDSELRIHRDLLYWDHCIPRFTEIYCVERLRNISTSGIWFLGNNNIQLVLPMCHYSCCEVPTDLIIKK